MDVVKHQDFDPSICTLNRVGRINRIIANIYRKHLSPFNITDSQLTTLFILAKKGDMTQKNICDLQRLEKSSLNRNLNRLVERNLLSKHNFPLVEITKEGIALVNEIIPAWQSAMKETQEFLNDDGLLAIDLLDKKTFK